MFDPAGPFVLLDDVAAGSARLFTGLHEVVRADTPPQVAPALDQMRGPGPWAGFIGFEAGYALEPRLSRLARPAPKGEPLLWFGRFALEQRLDGDAVAAMLGHGAAWVGAAAPDISRGDYDLRLARVQALIAAGDIYQANVTFAAAVATSGHPVALYARLRAGSRAPYGALVHTGSLWALSFSPELFFRLEGGRLTAKPMKGTATRGGDAADDAAKGRALQADPKNRAENLMIVDLLRNDLSRVGSDVQVPQLFEIETYPTVLQMTSTITATANPGIGAVDVLAAIFPCGSVTGAPKIRAMEVIAAVEPSPRGVYTGSIGAIAANGDAVFNVAIRTLVTTGVLARLGLGSGIVADSEAAAEWEECLAKSAFLARRGPPDLIETMRADSGNLPDLDRHLARMAKSAAFLGLIFDADIARAALLEATNGFTGRVRLLASPAGCLAVQCSPCPPPLEEPVAVAIAPLPVSVDDWRLRHKTSDRGFYDEARRQSGAFEVVFARPDGLITEGSFTSIFVERSGVLITPPLGLGLLPGILRQRLLDDGRAQEGEVTADDLSGEFLVGNALRGLIRAKRL